MGMFLASLKQREIMTALVSYLIVMLVFLFLCSILEAVLLSSTKSYIATMKKRGSQKPIERLKKLKENIDTPISSILTLNTFTSTMCAAGVGACTQVLFGEEVRTIFSIVLTLLILYVAEIIPKTIGALYWKNLLLPVSTIIWLLVIICTPFNWLSKKLTAFLYKNSQASSSISRDEFMAVVEQSEKEGSIHSKEGDLIENLLKLKNIKAKDIMTPRSVVFALPQDCLIKDAIENETMLIHSRIPIYDGNLDSVTGMVFNQKILEESIEGKHELTLKEISHEMHFVSENLPVPQLLDMFIKRKTHLFMVFDEYGQSSGVVSLEDAIETLLGQEIVDEMDEVEDMQVLARAKSKELQDRIKLQRNRPS